jgi:CMP-N-acetylneuraminic acid synthetase
MYKSKRFIAVIPARSGSKGLPDKNIKNLHGKPLMAWSIETALKSKYLDEVVVSTDSQKYADIAKNYGANIPFLRPPELSTDESTTFDVLKHTINFFTKKKIFFDYIVLLEPTSPLREDDDIDNMIEKIISMDDQFDSIVSVGEVDAHPSIVKKRLSDGSLVPYCSNLKMTTRRQDNDKALFPYCVAYISKIENFLDEKTFYTKRNTFYEIKKYQCYEIDDIYNFLSIENIMKYERKIK